MADDIEKIVRIVLETREPVCNISFTGATMSEPNIIRHWNEHWFPLRDKDGQVIGVSAVVEEITDRVQAEEALNQYKAELEQKMEVRTQELRIATEMLLHQNEELLSILESRKKMEQDLGRLAMALNQAGAGLILFNHDWIIEYVNPAYELMSGSTKEEIIGRDVEFLRKDTVIIFDSEIPQHAASGGKRWSGHIKRKKKSGEAFDVKLTVSPILDSEGRIIGYMSVVQDITHQIRLQQSMAQSQKMEAIGTLAGGIAHDLKNIFTPILINSEMVLEDVGADNPAYPLLKDILDASRTGVDLVKQIMTFARQASEEKIPVDIPLLVNETLTLLRSAIPKTIDIRARLEADNAKVQANPTQIKQVMMNLGSNAAYAMKDRHGHLEVDVHCIDLDRDAASKISPDLASGPYVELNVTDNGEGMDELTLDRAFDPFFTTKPEGEGTGMGLSVVQGIIKEHQGAISVWSKPGRGSTFRVLLPRLEEGCTDEKRKPQ
jgi:PAS domain S-box-containing protein